MKIKTELEADQLIYIRCALNSLQFTIERLEMLDKNNLGKVIYQGDREFLNKAREAVQSLQQNIIT